MANTASLAAIAEIPHSLCDNGVSNIENDIWINTVLNDLTTRSLGRTR